VSMPTGVNNNKLCASNTGPVCHWHGRGRLTVPLTVTGRLPPSHDRAPRMRSMDHPPIITVTDRLGVSTRMSAAQLEPEGRSGCAPFVTPWGAGAVHRLGAPGMITILTGSGTASLSGAHWQPPTGKAAGTGVCVPGPLPA
jgi:hypothetical protein